MRDKEIYSEIWSLIQLAIPSSLISARHRAFFYRATIFHSRLKQFLLRLNGNNYPHTYSYFLKLQCEY